MLKAYRFQMIRAKEGGIWILRLVAVTWAFPVDMCSSNLAYLSVDVDIGTITGGLLSVGSLSLPQEQVSMVYQTQ